ncbi:hypothetical protein MNV49_003235 [Pseudohyphozyma bogoriensis]|nr:hypothetical protein MNV49_003235 [Pseudohyphozyma bogoriensis]
MVEIAGFDIPDDVQNPYAWVQTTLVAQMYPPFTGGFKGRTAGLLVLLVFVIAVSAVYLWLQVRDAKKETKRELWNPLWAVRVVDRPAGRYLAINQYLLYPICSIASAGLWIAFAIRVYYMFGKQGSPTTLFLWMPMMWIPFYISAAITTFAVLAGANLSSVGSQPRSHKLSPLVHNALFVFLLPITVAGMAGVGIWAGIGWKHFAVSWQNTYDAASLAAAQWNGTVNAALDDELQQKAVVRLAYVAEFLYRESTCMKVYIAGAGCLVVINAIGGFVLLSKLRGSPDGTIVPIDQPIVARLAPLNSTETLNKDSDPFEDIAIDPAALQRSLASNVTLPTRLKRLDWDVTLFFLSVVPACLAFIAYCSWIILRFLQLMADGRQLEFFCTGIIWIYAALAGASLTAMVIKKLVTRREVAQAQSSLRRELLSEQWLKGPRPDFSRESTKEWDQQSVAEV